MRSASGVPLGSRVPASRTLVFRIAEQATHDEQGSAFAAKAFGFACSWQCLMARTVRAARLEGRSERVRSSAWVRPFKTRCHRAA
jgi:hypothetical protein